MRNTEFSDIRLPDRHLTDAVIAIEIEAASRDLWVSFIAAVLVILSVGGGLLTLTVELRSGWVSDHEVQMDKAAAVHKLLFRR